MSIIKAHNQSKLDERERRIEEEEERADKSTQNEFNVYTYIKSSDVAKTIIIDKNCARATSVSTSTGSLK